MFHAESICPPSRETVVERIAEGIIQYIASKGLKPGDRLPSERELVRMAGASRLPLREALCMLKGLGIVEARHGKGVFVKPLDLPAVFAMLSPLLRTRADIDVRHIFEVRLYLEASIAELAADYAGPENLAALEAACQAMQSSADDRAEWIRHDMEFHVELARATGNPIFPVFMASITDLVRQVQHLYRDQIDFRREAVIEHQEILKAVHEKDAAAARTAMQNHLREAMKRL